MRKIIYLFVAAIMVACSRGNVYYVADEDFAETVKMKKTLGIDALINDVSKFVKSGDHIIVENYRDSAIYCAYNYKSGELVRSWGYKGRANNEYSLPEIIQLEDGKFGINDMGKCRMEFYDNFDGHPSSIVEYDDLQMGVNDICHLQTNEYVYYNIIPGESTIYKWKVGEKPTPLPALDIYAERYTEEAAYGGFLGTNGDGKILYAFTYIDGFDIFDAEGNCVKQVRRKGSNGASTFEGYKEDESDEDYKVFSFRACCDKDGFYIYRVNYSSAELDESLERTTYIEQFDWDGRPIRRYELPMFFRNLCALGDGKFVVYDITSENEALQIFEPDTTN